MKKLTVALGIALSLAAEAKIKLVKQYELAFPLVEQHFIATVKKSPANQSDKDLLGLITIAGALKVEKFFSSSELPGQITITSVHRAITGKIQEHPAWNVSLGPEEVKHVTSNQDLLKKVFGDNSYEWAWFLKRRGEKAQAKKVLAAAFEATSKKIDQMQTLDFGGQSPLRDLELQRTALEPMCDARERARLNEKLQKAKIHLSNLPDSMIKT